MFNINDDVRVNRNGVIFEDTIISVVIHREDGKPEEIEYYLKNHDDRVLDKELTIVAMSEKETEVPVPAYTIGDVVEFQSEYSDRSPFDYMRIGAISIAIDDNIDVRYYPTSKGSEHLDWVDEESITCVFEPRVSTADRITINKYCRPGETVEQMIQRMTK